MLELPPASEVLAAMITPAVLIAAAGSLALSTSNRLRRVVDRVRTLGTAAEGLHGDAGLSAEEVEKRDLIVGQLGMLYTRIRMLQTALTAVYTAIGLLVATSLTVGLTAAVRAWLGWVPVAFGLAGASALFVASVYLVREARLAVAATVAEMEHVRRTVARKTGRTLS